MQLKTKFAKYLVNVPFIYKAINEKADLSVFTKKPERHIMIRNFTGLFLILFSYALGWPVVIILGIISFYSKEPLFLVIGGPIAYGVSHAVFWIGVYITGSHYAYVFLRWMVRKAVEKCIGEKLIYSALENKNRNAESTGIL